MYRLQLRVNWPIPELRDTDPRFAFAHCAAQPPDLRDKLRVQVGCCMAEKARSVGNSAIFNNSRQFQPRRGQIVKEKFRTKALTEQNGNTFV